MADLTITAANVVAGANATIREGTAGVALTAGQAVYLDSASSSYKLADCNSATAAVRSPKGIALHAAAIGQPIAILTEGLITIGAAVAVGVPYFLSGTPGGIRPVADNVSGDYVTYVGIGKSTTAIDVRFHESGAAMA
jgi:hypothetical protein